MKPQPRRLLLIVVGIAALFALLDPPSVWDAMQQTVYAAQAPVRGLNEWRDSRPPRPMPIRLGDRARYPRQSFGLLLVDRHGFRVDTFAGTASKDLIELPDTTIHLELSEAQMDTLYDAVIQMRYFDYPEPHPPIRANSTFALSNDMIGLRVRAGDATKDLTWNPGDEIAQEPVSDEWKRLRRLVRMVYRMVTSHPAYQALPKPEGYYID